MDGGTDLDRAVDRPEGPLTVGGDDSGARLLTDD